MAQALHWFDIDAFYLEAMRVLKDEGIIAIWTYNLLSITPEIDQIIQHLYAEILGPFWPAERQLIESDYHDIPFPFQRLNNPEFTMQTQWNLHKLTSYFQTWSAVQNYKAANNVDPVQYILPMLITEWDLDVTKKTITWPLRLMVGRHLN